MAKGEKRTYFILDRIGGPPEEGVQPTYAMRGTVEASGAPTALRQGAEAFDIEGFAVAVTARSWFEAPVGKDTTTRFTVGEPLTLL